MRDGLFLSVPPAVRLDKPVQLIAFQSGEQPLQCHFRHLVLVGRSAEATLIETYAGNKTSQPYFNNVVTEALLGENAQLDRYKVELESRAGYHIATFKSQQRKDSRLRNHGFSLGGQIARNETLTVLDDEGIDCELGGLYAADDERLVDHQVSVDHARPRSQSKQLFKGVLADRAKGVFCGRVHVHQDAQQTDAQQSNKNLLLSRSATINSKPVLEIFADDVKCSHGATVGQLDQEALYYLRARGIGKDQARHMLIDAFAAELIDRVRVEPLKPLLSAALADVLTTSGAR
jgi:Fe-S cluster assembly protein SufD